MSTSSILKDFIVKDKEAYEKLLKEIEEQSEGIPTATTNPCLSEGRKVLQKILGENKETETCK